jgi:signal transduction histidine kinase
MPPPDDSTSTFPLVEEEWPSQFGPELAVFRRFAVEMISIRSEDELYRHVARNVVGAMNFADCVIYRHSPESGVLEQVSAIGEKASLDTPDMIINPMIIRVGEGITGTVAQTGKPLIIKDVTKDPRYIPDIVAARSEICVPILNGDEVLGVIDCEHPLPDRFGRRELDILNSVAALTAAHLLQCRMIRMERSARYDLARALEASEQAQRSQSRFISSASHELRTPLNSIIGFASLLNRPGYFAENQERCESYAQTILEAGHHLAAVVNDVLEITAAAGGRLVAKPEGLDAGWETEQAILPLLAQAEEGQISIEAGELPLFAWCDVRHFHRILLNLTSNAIKFSEPGSPVSIRFAERLDGIEITVSDHGPGLAAEALETIFEPFHREPATGTSRSPGAGLGLTLARELAQANLGDIAVSSQLGVGSTFTLRLPTHIESEEAGTIEAAEPDQIFRRNRVSPTAAASA